MTDVMMGLGEFRFSIDTAAYQSLRRSNEWRWASQPRIGRRPALQAVGVGAHTITLSGFILPHWRGGLKRLDEMRVMGDKMEPLALTDGNGLVWGGICHYPPKRNPVQFERAWATPQTGISTHTETIWER